VDVRTIGIVADLHCGSRWGLTPEKYWSCYTSDAGKWLWQEYLAMVAGWPKLDLLILNGDMIDGKQRRAEGSGMITVTLEEQTDIAIDALAPMIDKAAKTIRVEGTSYHESFDGPLGKLDATFNIAKPTDVMRRIVRDIDLGDGAVLNVKHQPEGEGTLYRGTALDREVLWACITETLKRIPRATHLIRSHLHSDAHLRGFGKEINFTPGLCLQQPYALHKRRYRWVPDLGGTLMQRGKWGFHGWTVTPCCYRTPALEAESYAAL
jgi:hypothetical protein